MLTPTDLVAPGVLSAVDAASGKFPFGFRREAISFAILLAKPFAELHRLETGDVDNGVIVAGAVHSFRLMPRIEALVLRVGDGMLSDVKAAESHGGERLFVRLGLGVVAAHDEIPWRQKHHGCANRAFEICREQAGRRSYLRH